MFTFAHPYYFFLLLPVAVCGWTIYRRRPGGALRFAPTMRIAGRRVTWRVVLSRILPVLYLASLALMVTALARPRTVLSRVRRSADLIAIEMVVDVSGSMDALDMSEIRGRRMIKERTRLDVVKEKFAEFVKKRPEDMVGLVSFGGYASTRSPLTTDHNALLHTLAGVQTPRESTHGKDPEEWRTAIGDALATACARLQHTQPKSRIIVLLSDGESNTGLISPEEAMEAAKKMGIKVYTIGVGSTGEARARAGTDMFGRPRYGTMEVTLDEEMLKRIAETTGGKYFNATDQAGLEAALEDINSLEKTTVEQDVYHNYNELFPWCLGPALGLVLLGSCLNILVSRRIV